MAQQAGGYLARPAPSGLADVIEIILDKGIVIDAYARVSLVGIELMTLDARIVVSSVDTYLRFAEATERLDLPAVGPEDPMDKLAGGLEQTVEKVADSVVEDKVEELPAPVRKTARGAAKTARGAAKVATKATRAAKDAAPGRKD